MVLPVRFCISHNERIQRGWAKFRRWYTQNPFSYILLRNKQIYRLLSILSISILQRGFGVLCGKTNLYTRVKNFASSLITGNMNSIDFLKPTNSRDFTKEKSKNSAHPLWKILPLYSTWTIYSTNKVKFHCWINWNDLWLYRL